MAVCRVLCHLEILAGFDRDSVFARGTQRRCGNRCSLHWMGRSVPPHCCYLKPTILATYAGCVLLCVMSVIYFCSALKLPDCLPCDARLDGAITSASIERCCCAYCLHQHNQQPTSIQGSLENKGFGSMCCFWAIVYR